MTAAADAVAQQIVICRIAILEGHAGIFHISVRTFIVCRSSHKGRIIISCTDRLRNDRFFFLEVGLEVDLVLILVQSLYVQTERLHFLDEYLEGFRQTRLRYVLSLDDCLIGVDTAYGIVGLDSQDLLQGVSCTVCFQCPNFHFAETLTAELSLTAQRLLGNQSVQFEQCSFENFDLNYYRGFQTENGGSCYQAMEKVYFFCQEYARQFTNHSSSILMFGKTGRGKTHLSLAIANRVLQNGYNVLYDSAINFLRQVEKEHFGRGGSNDDTLDTLLSCDLLILDDLGTEFHKQFYQSTVYNIINTRMNRDLPTIISTNLNHNEISALYDERITSRIYTTYTCLHFVGQDVRVLKKSRMQNG